jgi:hypothetical protein
MSYYLFCFQLNDFILFVIIWTIVSEFCLLERPGQPVKYIREGYKKRVSQKKNKKKNHCFDISLFGLTFIIITLSYSK